MFGVRAAIEAMSSLKLGGITHSKNVQTTLNETLKRTILMAFSNPQSAIVCTLGEKTVAFIPTAKHILLLDSHCHGATGAFVALAFKDHVLELLSWYKDPNGLELDQGRVTRVSFVSTTPVAAANLYPQ